VDTTWRIPAELPDLRGVGLIALDTEERDDRLNAGLGPGWPVHQGHVSGLSVAWRESGIQKCYLPIRHPDTQNFDPDQVYRWLRDHIAAGLRFVTQNGLYDWGWMPGKDQALLLEGIAALGLDTGKRKKKKFDPRPYIWQLPARYVGPYAEADAVNTLLLYEDLDPIIDREGTRAAYRLECDILPMVQVMRARGIRIDSDAAERARDHLFGKRDAVFAELSSKLECPVGMVEVRSKTWMPATFERLGIEYPRTEKGNPSFTAGQRGWMPKNQHWLPQLIVKALRYHDAADKFLQGHILNHIENGRIYADIHPHRSESNGTKSFRFSYSDPPLQQMPSHDEEITPLIRGVFLPEEGEVWAKPDVSQQEFRILVHYAAVIGLPGAAEAAAEYCNNPVADFHQFTARTTGLDRNDGKTINFAKIYGAGVEKLAAMMRKTLEETQQILAQHCALPFIKQLDEKCKARAKSGHITLYDGAKRHFDKFGPKDKKYGGAEPCDILEAQRRHFDPQHPWYNKPLEQIGAYTALNALIQGTAARHTKLWMRAVWREGIVPLIQMHDALDCSVSSREQAELVARLGCEAVQLKVPMRVDLKFGRTWADATHTWEELHGEVVQPKPEVTIGLAAEQSPEPARAQPMPSPSSLNGHGGGNGASGQDLPKRHRNPPAATGRTARKARRRRLLVIPTPKTMLGNHSAIPPCSGKATGWHGHLITPCPTAPCFISSCATNYSLAGRRP
jgi:DNA polymerase I-like protein with 3'-5' exonuclease and polymerase domains